MYDALFEGYTAKTQPFAKVTSKKLRIIRHHHQVSSYIQQSSSSLLTLLRLVWTYAPLKCVQFPIFLIVLIHQKLAVLFRLSAHLI